ncbi:MAG: hypothetical protein HFI37_05380, partial [Lachnospiraceae bacterium]|nr:hypothetical protein [Lachnospiraceae bacterium]
MNKKNGKVIKYRKSLKISIGTIVFGIILLYLVFNVFFYLTKKHISVYEVQQGTIVTNHVYRGLIVRSEEIVTSASNGHVNYYLQDASKAGVKTPVYSLDNSGDATSQIEETKKSKDIFRKEDYLAIDATVQSYIGNYDNQNFYSVYS